MGQHFSDTRKLVNCGTTSASFANNFVSHIEYKIEDGTLKKAKTGDIRDLVKMSILWEGNAIFCNKPFGKINCKLCMNERIAILEKIRRDRKMDIKK